jgi:hypothetical protein
MAQSVQIAGAFAILAAFAAAQARVLDVRAHAYLVLNAAGAAVLAVAAWHERQWGFLLLEGTWALVSAWGLARATAPRTRKSRWGERLSQ